MALREILVELGIEVDDENAERTIENIRRGLRRMGDSSDDATKKAKKGIRGLISNMGGLQKAIVAAGAAFLTGKLAQGLFATVEAASDAAEITNKLGAVFNEQTPRAEAFGSELAQRIGQSRIQIQQMTADVGALVKPLVGSEEAALDMAQAVTELSFDISSFENVSPDEALMAFRSALIGSSEPMLRFGVDTRQAALAQFALEKGIKKSVKEMSNAEVTALRLELVQKRLGEKGAVGDATKTAGGFANRMRALQGAFKDLQAEIGKQFLPVAGEVLTVMIDFIRQVGPDLAKAARGTAMVFRGLLRIMRAGIRIFKGLYETLTSAEGVIMVLSLALGGLGIAFQTVGISATVAGLKAAAAWVIATAPVLLMIVLLGIIIATILLVIEDLYAMGDGAESVSGTIIQGFMDLVDELGSIPAAIAEMLATALEYWLEFFGMTHEEAKAFTDNLFETLGSFWQNTIDFYMGLWNSFVAWLGETLTTAIDFWADMLRNFWTGIINFWGGLFDDFIGGIMGAFSKVGDFFSELFGGGEEAGAKKVRQAPSVREQVQAATEKAKEEGLPTPRQPFTQAGATMREAARTAAPSLQALAQPGNVAGVAPTAVTAPGGGKTLINQPKTDVKVEVNASGTQSSADDIAGAVAREVESAMERRDRQTMQAFTVQLEAG